MTTPTTEAAYVTNEERVLDPTLLDKSALERMPDPSGWRMLVLPYKGKAQTDGGIHLLKETIVIQALVSSWKTVERSE